MFSDLDIKFNSIVELNYLHWGLKLRRPVWSWREYKIPDQSAKTKASQVNFSSSTQDRSQLFHSCVGLRQMELL